MSEKISPLHTEHKIPKPLMLLILDGWGYSEITKHNAIEAASKPVWDSLWEKYPSTLIRTSGAAVGLPAEQMGNSEVGHLNIGAGRVVYQEFTRVSHAIKTGSFFNNHTLTDAVDTAIKNDKAVHVMGLLSEGGVHSHEEHIQAMMRLASEQGASRVYLHAFTDGRDTPPRSAMHSVKKMEEEFKDLKGCRFASLVGRYYAMDRDHRWSRIEAAYDLITQGKAEYQAVDAETAVNMAYERDENDEFIKATAIVPKGASPVKVEDGDVMIFMNFRSDRARQITRAFIEPDFDGFERAVTPQLARYVCLTEYNSEFDAPVAYPAERLHNIFGEYISDHGLRQLRIAETEKYAHVTFFFNGGREEPFEGEDRVLIKSPMVATYDLQPEMNAPEVTDKLVEAIEGGLYDVIICNYANTDMVGHTGKFSAAVKAVEAVDAALGRLQVAMHKAGGEMLITADHGNAEEMVNSVTGQPHTAHTTNLVPLIYVGRAAQLAEHGALSDLAPTMLSLMNMEIPPEMTGTPLVELLPVHGDQDPSVTAVELQGRSA